MFFSFLPLPAYAKWVYRGEKFSHGRKWCRQLASEQWVCCIIVCQLFTAGVVSPCRFSFTRYVKAAKESKISRCVQESERTNKCEGRVKKMLRLSSVYSEQLRCSLNEGREAVVFVKGWCFLNTMGHGFSEHHPHNMLFFYVDWKKGLLRALCKRFKGSQIFTHSFISRRPATASAARTT